MFLGRDGPPQKVKKKKKTKKHNRPKVGAVGRSPRGFPMGLEPAVADSLQHNRGAQRSMNHLAPFRTGRGPCFPKTLAIWKCPVATTVPRALAPSSCEPLPLAAVRKNLNVTFKPWSPSSKKPAASSSIFPTRRSRDRVDLGRNLISLTLDDLFWLLFAPPRPPSFSVLPPGTCTFRSRAACRAGGRAVGGPRSLLLYSTRNQAGSLGGGVPN